MTALSFVWVHPYSQNSRCDIMSQFIEAIAKETLKFICFL